MKGCAAAALAISAVSAADATTYTYVGSWFVDQGVWWTDNPPVYSGQEAAAFLFGGSASHYAISTEGVDPSMINFKAFYDGWADPYTCGYNGPCAQNMHVDVDNDGYESPFATDAAFSALVSDHGLHLQNFAFIATPAPEPASWAMMLGGFGLIGGAMRMRRRNVAVSFG